MLRAQRARFTDAEYYSLSVSLSRYLIALYNSNWNQCYYEHYQARPHPAFATAHCESDTALRAFRPQVLSQAASDLDIPSRRLPDIPGPEQFDFLTPNTSMWARILLQYGSNTDRGVTAQGGTVNNFRLKAIQLIALGLLALPALLIARLAGQQWPGE